MNDSDRPLGPQEMLGIDEILLALTLRQHLHPHQALRSALLNVSQATGICPQAIAAAIHRLDLDPELSLGRLRRTEMMQLARCIYRYWREANQSSGAIASRA